MLPVRIACATRVFGPPQDWDADLRGPCLNLAIRDEVIEGANYMTSRWEPTPVELALLMAGGVIELRIMGVTHPVISLIAATAEAAD